MNPGRFWAGQARRTEGRRRVSVQIGDKAIRETTPNRRLLASNTLNLRFSLDRGQWRIKADVYFFSE
jgi:hypothetical protein